MKISTYDKFQALLRTPWYPQRHPECKTVLELIQAIEKDCRIESPSGSPWVKYLIIRARQYMKTGEIDAYEP